MARSHTALAEIVASFGGVVRTARLGEAGISRSSIDHAMREGTLLRVRRGWVAVPGADVMLVSAAKAGVVLTCLTQAERLGLWVHERPAQHHVGANPHGAPVTSEHIHVHWARPLVPRHPDALTDPIENVLALVADCEPYEQALATWESALNKGLVDLSILSKLPLKTAARRIADNATPFADAGLETYLRPRLRWLRVPLTFQIWIAGHRVDALLGQRLVLQVDGGTHVGAQRVEDNRHDAQLRLMGYTVIRVSYTQVMFAWEGVQDQIMRAVAMGLHKAA